MTKFQNADPLIVDARGHRCPIPVLRLGKAIRSPSNEGPIGSILILATDPMAVIDIPHFCHTEGHTIVEQNESFDEERQSKVYQFLIHIKDF
ncbi:MAG: sulfurtransferase TusA family protein [Pseudomonadota bacterium]